MVFFFMLINLAKNTFFHKAWHANWWFVKLTMLSIIYVINTSILIDRYCCFLSAKHLWFYISVQIIINMNVVLVIIVVHRFVFIFIIILSMHVVLGMRVVLVVIIRLRFYFFISTFHFCVVDGLCPSHLLFTTVISKLLFCQLACLLRFLSFFLAPWV